VSEAPTQADKPRRSGWLGLIFRVCATFSVLGVILYNVDWQTTTATMAKLSVGAGLLAIALIVFMVSNGALRWWLVCRSIDVPLRPFEALRYFYITGFANQAMPGTFGGDGLRIFLMHRAGHDAGAVTSSIVVDRACALVGLGLLVVVTQPFVPSIVGTSGSFAVFALLLFALVGGIVVFAFFGHHLLESTYKLVRAVGGLADAMRRLLMAPRYGLPAVGCAMLTFIVASASTGVLGVSMGLQAEFWHYLVLCPPVFLLAVLPVSVAGWGVREAGMVVALGYAGVPAEEALAVSVAWGIVNLIGVLPGGGLWLASR